jgi:short-subunit dehydrogenase
MITGASSGIGRGLAVALGSKGARVGLVARRAQTLDEVVAEIESSGGRQTFKTPSR